MSFAQAINTKVYRAFTEGKYRAKVLGQQLDPNDKFVDLFLLFENGRKQNVRFYQTQSYLNAITDLVAQTDLPDGSDPASIVQALASSKQIIDVWVYYNQQYTNFAFNDIFEYRKQQEQQNQPTQTNDADLNSLLRM